MGELTSANDFENTLCEIRSLSCALEYDPPARVQVKIFWDKECLVDGKNWLEGFVLVNPKPSTLHP